MSDKIANDFGQFNYDLDTRDEILFEGQQHATSKGRRALNPLLPQVSVTTFAGADDVDGLYQITITHKVTGKTTVFSTTVAGTQTLVATVALLQVASEGVFLSNTAIVTNNALVLTTSFIHALNEYDVVASVPGGITAPTVTTAAGGVLIPFGRFMIFDSSVDEDGMALPLDASTAVQMRAVSGRSLSVINQESANIDDVDAYPPGADMRATKSGWVAMKNVGSVAAVKGGDVHVVRNTAGGDERGQARSDADGGNTVVMAQRDAYWATATAVDAVGWVETAL